MAALPGCWASAPNSGQRRHASASANSCFVILKESQSDRFLAATEARTDKREPWKRHKDEHGQAQLATCVLQLVLCKALRHITRFQAGWHRGEALQACGTCSRPSSPLLSCQQPDLVKTWLLAASIISVLRPLIRSSMALTTVAARGRRQGRNLEAAHGKGDATVPKEKSVPCRASPVSIAKPLTGTTLGYRKLQPLWSQIFPLYSYTQYQIPEIDLKMISVVKSPSRQEGLLGLCRDRHPRRGVKRLPRLAGRSLC